MTTTTIVVDDALAALRTPFPREQIGRLPKGGAFLDYVGHADVTNRLLDADPGWTWEPVAFDSGGLPLFDSSGGLWIRLTVCGVTRLGYGDAAGKKGPNAVKEAIGDALRNAAMRYGVALDLWCKGDREFGIGHDTGTPQQQDEPLPAHVQAAYSAIGALSPDDRDVLRQWAVDTGTVVDRHMSPEVAQTVVDRALAQAKR